MAVEPHTTVSALCALVLLLGLKHGFDADHLAVIDGLTRFNRRAGRPFARWCGALFSLGHGAVVAAVGLLAGSLQSHWAPPGWLGTTGAVVSIGFLLLLGVANLHGVLSAAPGAVARPVASIGGMAGRLCTARRPLSVAAVGALFALSLDTVAQSVFFALAGKALGGTAFTVGLAALFTLGMLITDALNGLWMAHLLERTDRRAAAASRAMGAVVGMVSLLVAAFALARLVLPRGGSGLASGALVLAVVTGGAAVACAVTRRTSRSPAAAEPGPEPSQERSPCAPCPTR